MVPKSEGFLIHQHGTAVVAKALLGELRQLKRGGEVPGWVRWRGLCVGLEEVPEQPVEGLFARPLPARVVRVT